MHILFVSPVGCIGGAERILLEAVRQVRLLRPSWQVAAILFADGPLRPALTELGANVEVVELPASLAASGDSNLIRSASESENGRSVRFVGRLGSTLRGVAAGFRFAGFLWRLRATLRRLGPQLIHSNGIKSHLCLSLVSRRRCPVIWHIHDFYSLRPQVGTLMRIASRRARGCLAISRAVQRDIATLAPSFDARLLENSVDTDRFTPGPGNPEALDRAAGFSTGGPLTLTLSPGYRGEGTMQIEKPLILTISPEDKAEGTMPRIRVGLVATYANWKGQDVFLRAIQRCPGVVAFIIGGPIYTTVGSQWTLEELRNQAEALGIADRVGFVDFQSEPVWVYRTLDVVVHASIRPEPFGLTIIEAMSSGRAVVVAKAGGAGALFTDGFDAVGHQPGDVESLAAAIHQVAADASFRERLGANARQTALQRFSCGRFGNELVTALESFR